MNRAHIGDRVSVCLSHFWAVTLRSNCDIINRDRHSFLKEVRESQKLSINQCMGLKADRGNQEGRRSRDWIAEIYPLDTGMILQRIGRMPG